MDIDTSDANTSGSIDDNASDNSINDINTNEKSVDDDNTGDNSVNDTITSEKSVDDDNTDDNGIIDTNTSDDSIIDTNTSDDSINDTNTSDSSINDTNTSDSSINDANTSEIDTIYGKKLRVTCTERTYKVVDKKVSFFIVTRKEFDKDRTEKMLHEDMELKTFLANYEITNITFSSPSIEDIKIQKKKLHEIGKFEIGKKEESEATKKRRDIIMNTLKRRELFDSLDLPKEFLVRDYIEAVEKNGFKISNSAMPYDDLKWLAKKGKVEMIKKVDHGAISYRIRKTEIDAMDSLTKDDQLDMDHEETPLPSKHSIDKCIN